ncbi:hypothetical protein V8F20_003422 [Naviculisporaceae sp. PSN 640]
MSSLFGLQTLLIQLRPLPYYNTIRESSLRPYYIRSPPATARRGLIIYIITPSHPHHLPPRHHFKMSAPHLQPGARVEHALLIKGLPRGITAAQLLVALSVFGPFGDGRGGRIFDVGPVVPGGIIPWDSVRVVMWTQSAAAALYDFVAGGGLVLQGKVAQVSVDTSERDYTVPGIVANSPVSASRVLVVRGPKHIVDMHQMDAFFRSRINIEHYTMPEMRVVAESGGERQMVVTFDSWFGQAMWAREGFDTAFLGQVAVRYGSDPIEHGIVNAALDNNEIR